MAANAENAVEALTGDLRRRWETEGLSEVSAHIRAPTSDAKASLSFYVHLSALLSHDEDPAECRRPRPGWPPKTASRTRSDVSA